MKIKLQSLFFCGAKSKTDEMKIENVSIHNWNKQKNKFFSVQFFDLISIAFSLCPAFVQFACIEFCIQLELCLHRYQ